MIPDEAVEAAAKVAYAVKPAKYYLDDSVVTWGQLGDSRSGQLRKDQELSKMRAALEAAAPHLTRAAQAQAWDEGWDTFAGFDSRPGGPYPTNPYRSEERGTE